MSGFRDEDFSLGELLGALPYEDLDPGTLAERDHDLRVRSWRERVRRFLERSDAGPPESVSRPAEPHPEPCDHRFDHREADRGGQ